MTVTDGVPPFLIGDNVTVTCATGRALSVDLNQNGTDRVVASQILSCLDDPASPEGRWTELTENCTGKSTRGTTTYDCLNGLFFRMFDIFLFCFVVAMSEPVHDMKAILLLCLC